MYKLNGKPGKPLYEIDIKENSNCPDSEKSGSGPGSCGGSDSKGIGKGRERTKKSSSKQVSIQPKTESKKEIPVSKMIEHLGLHEDTISQWREDYINSGMHEDSADNMVDGKIKQMFEDKFKKTRK